MQEVINDAAFEGILGVNAGFQQRLRRNSGQPPRLKPQNNVYLSSAEARNTDVNFVPCPIITGNRF